MKSQRKIETMNFDNQKERHRGSFTRTGNAEGEKQNKPHHLFSEKIFNDTPSNTTAQIIRLSQLTEILSISRSCVYDWLNPRSPRHDPSFPKQIHLTGRAHGGAVGWRLDSIIAWIESRSR